MLQSSSEQLRKGNYKKYSYYVIAFVVVYLVIVYLLSFFIDFLNMFGIRDLLEHSGYNPPILWVLIFLEGSLTEHIQWAILGLSIILAVYNGGLQIKIGSSSPVKWLFLQAGLMLMFLEDLLNVRFAILIRIAESYQIEPLELMNTIWGSLIEASFYGLIGLVMLIFLICILKDRKESIFGKKLLVIGYIFYGIASVGSATRNIGSWYSVTGTKILDSITSGFSLEWSAETIVIRNPLGFWFIDLVVEESLELLGAAFILAALIAFIAFTKTNRANLTV